MSFFAGMDRRQLHYFVAIVEAGAFSRAAGILRIAQPALSQHVLAMEAELGTKLLQRHPRGVTPTEAGARLLEHAREIEARFVVLADAVRDPASPSGEVRFGMPATINEQIGVALIEAAKKLYPKLRIRISEAMSGFVLDWLRGNTVDLALLYNVADGKNLVLHPALTEEICLFARMDLQPAPGGESVTFARAVQLPLILPGPAHGLRELIEQAARGTGAKLAPEIEIDSYRQIKELVARGAGFGMLPATAIRQEVADGLVRAWAMTQPALRRRIYLGYRSGQPLTTAARAVAQLSWNILQAQVGSGAWPALWDGSNPPALYP